MPSGSLLNDLHRFDPTTLTWIDLTPDVRGAVPEPRAYHGMASAGGFLLVFGGYTSTGIFPM